jgi:hypothetical protein
LGRPAVVVGAAAMRWGLPGLAGGEAFEPGPGDEGVEDWQEHDAVVVGQFGDGGDLVAEGVCGGPELPSAVDGQSAVVSAARSRPPRDGWMWDLTVPGNNDYDFYVAVAAFTELRLDPGKTPQTRHAPQDPGRPVGRGGRRIGPARP